MIRLSYRPERIRQRIWVNLDELKKVFQDELSKITIKEVRTMVAKIPKRYRRVANSSRKPIISSCSDDSNSSACSDDSRLILVYHDSTNSCNP